jgi:glucose-6-phosphate 1-dehydrogenase
MSARPRNAPQIALFGASGDLARRKLFPALVRLAREHEFSVLGIARRERSDEAFRKELGEALPAELHGAFEEHLAPRLHYQAADAADAASLEALAGRLDELPGGAGAGRLFYLSLRPGLFADAVQALADAGLLAAPQEQAWRRVVVEKPFGRDRCSARELNRSLHRVLREEQIYRIDHYLGKETVQNVLGFRFHNAVFEPLWSRQHVELVQITVAEEIPVESGRGDYYDQAGALRDVVQNHMLQVLALCAMEPPPSLEAEAVRDQKVTLLRGLRLPDPAEAAASCVRGRYGPGDVGGERVPGYTQQEDVPSDSGTETYVALRAQIESWRWQGVPFLLRHGKRLPRRFTEVQVQFRTPPLQLFGRPEGASEDEFGRELREGARCRIRPNRLTLRLQPEPAVRLAFAVKEPGERMRMAPAELAFDYREHFGRSLPSAYERLLLDALRGDPTLFLRADEVEAAWGFVDAVRAGWQHEDGPPLLEYPAGSWGPPQAEELFRGCEGSWSRG